VRRSVALRKPAADLHMRTSALVRVLALTFCALALAACEHDRASVTLPNQSLLTPQPAPDCTFKGSERTGEAKLDYERQCYRHAEQIARARLQKLQGSVQRTIDTAKRNKPDES
jgi:hypothetical protein